MEAMGRHRRLAIARSHPAPNAFYNSSHQPEGQPHVQHRQPNLPGKFIHRFMLRLSHKFTACACGCHLDCWSLVEGGGRWRRASSPTGGAARPVEVPGLPRALPQQQPPAAGPACARRNSRHPPTLQAPSCQQNSGGTSFMLARGAGRRMAGPLLTDHEEVQAAAIGTCP